MSKVKLNKSSLSREIRHLKSYRQFLPSLDLKRRKLLSVKIKEKQEELNLLHEIQADETTLTQGFPMVANEEINLEKLLSVKSVEIIRDNIVGISLPVLHSINFDVFSYTWFNSPAWLDNFIILLQKLIEKRMRHTLAKMRLGLVDTALRTITQRKNLFEKVLIPQTRKNIKTIQIFLSDNERAAVVRSKIAKRKRLPA